MRKGEAHTSSRLNGSFQAAAPNWQTPWREATLQILHFRLLLNPQGQLPSIMSPSVQHAHINTQTHHHHHHHRHHTTPHHTTHAYICAHVRDDMARKTSTQQSAGAPNQPSGSYGSVQSDAVLHISFAFTVTGEENWVLVESQVHKEKYNARRQIPCPHSYESMRRAGPQQQRDHRKIACPHLR